MSKYVDVSKYRSQNIIIIKWVTNQPVRALLGPHINWLIILSKIIISSWWKLTQILSIVIGSGISHHWNLIIDISFYPLISNKQKLHRIIVVQMYQSNVSKGIKKWEYGINLLFIHSMERFWHDGTEIKGSGRLKSGRYLKLGLWLSKTGVVSILTLA